MLIIGAYFLPFPVQDEKTFWLVWRSFGENYLPSLSQLKHMQSPMGPLFFVFYGFLGKLCGFNPWLLRSINIVLAYITILFIYNIYKRYLAKAEVGFATSWFIFTPYFYFLTTPFLYTDILNLLLIITGVYAYVLKQKKLLGVILLGLATCTRQFSIIVVVALFFTEFLSHTGRDRYRLGQYLHLLIPFIMFLPLYLLWGGVTSGQHPGGAFTENTVSAFKFSFRSLNYSLLISGLYSLPLIWQRFNLKQTIQKHKYLCIYTAMLVFMGLILITQLLPISPDLAGAIQGYQRVSRSCSYVPIAGYLPKAFNLAFALTYILIPAAAVVFVLVAMRNIKLMVPVIGVSAIAIALKFPRLINIDSNYVKDIAGYLDRYIVAISWFAYILVPLIFVVFMCYFIQELRVRPLNKMALFSRIYIITFIIFESIYTYTWDKHYLIIMPFFFLINTKARDKKA